MMNFGYYQPFGFFGPLFMLFVWIIIIVAIIAFGKWFAGQIRNSSDEGDRALEILKERYAKGEIDEKEFAEKKKNLMNI